MKKLIYTLILFSIISCDSISTKRKNLIPNGISLAIDHFKAEDSDSLKLEALYFLLENMKNHGAYYYIGVNPCDQIFTQIGKINPPKGEIRRTTWESFETEFANFSYSNVEFRRDDKAVTAAFLIDNIDLAFKAWRTYPWCKHLSFDDFNVTSYLIELLMNQLKFAVNGSKISMNGS